MKKFSKFLLSLVVVTGLLLPTAADAYQVEQDPIDFGGYFPGYATNELIVLHESGNGNPNSLDNETAYMKRNWTSAYVSYFVGSGGRVKQLAPVGQIQWGAERQPMQKHMQIELARTNNKETFKKDCCLCQFDS